MAKHCAPLAGGQEQRLEAGRLSGRNMYMSI